MAKWTIGEGDDELIIEANGRRVTLSIPSGKPIVTDPMTAADIRTKLGAAIGVATGGPTGGPTS